MWTAAGLLLCGLAFQETTPAVAPETILSQYGVLESPGGDLLFGLEILREASGELRATLLNIGEEIDVPRVELNGDRLVLGFDHYASRIEARLMPWEEAERYGPQHVASGVWVKRLGEGRECRLPFRTFVPLNPWWWGDPSDSLVPSEYYGEWEVTFRGEDGQAALPGIARFGPHESHSWVQGTFLTATGDYRYLSGRMNGGALWLSCFDGAHAFLFKAALQEDGTLRGEFWSGDSWHETWTAKRLPEGADPASVLPDSLSMTALKSGEALEFTFPDLDGKPVRYPSERFAGKALVVEIFGSWCPNCHDAAPLLRELREEFGPQGLEVLGLAYELSGDPALDAEQVRRYKQRHGCDWTVLLAGTAPKKGASRTLPSLTGIKSYPTTLFIDREGRVRTIYTGFAGPATGAEHKRLRATWRAAVEAILAPNAD